MLDRKNHLLDNLEFIKSSYLNLLLLKQLEYDFFEKASYELLHELSENERRIIEDINGTLKCIVPDLVYFREDREIKEKVSEIDRLQASNHLEALRQLTDEVVIPCSAVGEFALRNLSEKGIISYQPGASKFTILQPDALGETEQNQLRRLQDEILDKYGSTGVQQVLNTIVFDILQLIPVYPVEDAGKLTDHDGNILPDVYLVPQGTTARQLAYKIHTDLGETFIHALDARTKKRLAENYELKANDVIRIVAAGATH